MPISAATFDLSGQPSALFCSASIGACCVVLAVLLRLHLSWSFVGQRLLSAQIEYEESGWYDGEVWAKPATVVARDRLVHFENVAPALSQIRTALAAAAAACCVSLIGLQLTASHSSSTSQRSSYERERELAQQQAAAIQRCVLSVLIRMAHEQTLLCPRPFNTAWDAASPCRVSTNCSSSVRVLLCRLCTARLTVLTTAAAVCITICLQPF